MMSMSRRSVCCQENKIKYWKVAYFRAFCKVGIIREALRKARFYYMETYLLFGLIGEKVDGRKIAVGFRLWIRCHRFRHWDCWQSRPQFKPLDTKRQTWQWNRCYRRSGRDLWIFVSSEGTWTYVWWKNFYYGSGKSKMAEEDRPQWIVFVRKRKEV